jgi:hypothetical protein
MAKGLGNFSPIFFKLFTPFLGHFHVLYVALPTNGPENTSIFTIILDFFKFCPGRAKMRKNKKKYEFFLNSFPIWRVRNDFC